MVRLELGQVGVGPGAKVMRVGRRRKWRRVSQKKGGIGECIGEREAVMVRSESGQVGVGPGAKVIRVGRRRKWKRVS
jgi:hypothetical protein